MPRINSEEIMHNLDVLYPDAHCELNHKNAFELLIAVILSAQTTDARVNMCTPELFEKYGTASKLGSADIKDIERIIKPIGLYHNKALSITNTAKAICDNFGGFVPDNLNDLVTLPGVGRKTANVILSNCFDVPAFAVDTHVSRVSKRLYIAALNDDVGKIEKKLNRFFPKEKWCKLHHQMIFFGRYTCKAIKPECDNCPFKGKCRETRSS